MYHITQQQWPDEIVLYPRATGKFRSARESKQKRICVAPTIVGCLAALGACIDKDKPAYVYKTFAETIPADNTVIDAKYTGERWILKRARFYKVGTLLFDILSMPELHCILGGCARDFGFQQYLHEFSYSGISWDDYVRKVLPSE